LAMAEMDRLHAWDLESQMHEMIGRFKLSEPNARVGTLSGGQQKRLALAKLLLTEPDIMLLDEPTNHLDLSMIEWLENHLSSRKGTLLLVTHDRYFLEVVCDRILEMENGKLYSYKGNYSYYLEKKAEKDEAEATTLAKNKQFLRKEVEWIRRQPKARGTKSKSRTETYYQKKRREQAKKRKHYRTLKG
jgi:ATP-binding cassette subfamily F protein uup